MEKSTWYFEDKEKNLRIPQISRFFHQEKIQSRGDRQSGTITLISKKIADEVWGPEVKAEITWETIDPKDYHHGLKVKESIDTYGAIQIVAVGKENSWHLSHERTIWHGRRQQVKRRRFYASKIMHGIFFCDQTFRIFDIHVEVLDKKYEKYQKPILRTMDSIQCHKI
jgi:hypothetical protein